jgi:hypothetical protein
VHLLQFFLILMGLFRVVDVHVSRFKSNQLLAVNSRLKGDRRPDILLLQLATTCKEYYHLDFFSVLK